MQTSTSSADQGRPASSRLTSFTNGVLVHSVHCPTIEQNTPTFGVVGRWQRQSMECGGQRAVWPAANAPGVALSPPAARAALRDRAAAAVDRSSPTRSSPLGVRTNTPPPAAAACPSPTLLETLAFAASAQRPHAVGPPRYSAVVAAAVPASENVGRTSTVHRACRILPAQAADTAGSTAAGPLDDALSSSKTRPLREPTALDVVGRASHCHHRALTIV